MPSLHRCVRGSISTAGTSTGSRRAWITHSRTCPNASALASRAVGRSIGLIGHGPRAERIEHQRHLVEFSRSRSQRSRRGQIRGRREREPRTRSASPGGQGDDGSRRELGPAGSVSLAAVISFRWPMAGGGLVARWVRVDGYRRGVTRRETRSSVRPRPPVPVSPRPHRILAPGWVTGTRIASWRTGGSHPHARCGAVPMIAGEVCPVRATDARQSSPSRSERTRPAREAGRARQMRAGVLDRNTAFLRFCWQVGWIGRLDGLFLLSLKFSIQERGLVGRQIFQSVACVRAKVARPDGDGPRRNSLFTEAWESSLSPVQQP